MKYIIRMDAYEERDTIPTRVFFLVTFDHTESYFTKRHPDPDQVPNCGKSVWRTSLKPYKPWPSYTRTNHGRAPTSYPP